MPVHVLWSVLTCTLSVTNIALHVSVVCLVHIWERFCWIGNVLSVLRWLVDLFHHSRLSVCFGSTFSSKLFKVCPCSGLQDHHARLIRALKDISRFKAEQCLRKVFNVCDFNPFFCFWCSQWLCSSVLTLLSGYFAWQSRLTDRQASSIFDHSTVRVNDYWWWCIKLNIPRGLSQ